MFKNMQRPDLGIDLGTSKFSVCSRQEGIVCSEPAYMALEKQSKGRTRVIAIGREAEAMAGKCPPHIEVLCPMREGIIVQPELAAMLLQSLVKQAGVQGFFKRRRKLLVGTIWGATIHERKAFIDVAGSLGAMNVAPIAEPLAAAIGCSLPIDEPQGQMLLDVGSGASEVIVISRGRVALGRSIRVGGHCMDQSIVDLVLKRYNVLLPMAEARRAKELLGLGCMDREPIRLKGYDRQYQTPCEVRVPAAEIQSALQHPIAQIVKMVQGLLEEIQPELAADIIGSGMYLTGGGALSRSLQQSLQHTTQLDIHRAENPSEAVVRGCHSVLSYLDLVS